MDNELKIKFSDYIQFLSDVKDNDGNHQFQCGDNEERWECRVVNHSTILSFERFCEGKYRIKPKRVPLELSDIKPGTAIRRDNSHEGDFTTILFANSAHVSFYNDFSAKRVEVSYKSLMDGNAQYSTDFGETWQYCSKEASDE